MTLAFHIAALPNQKNPIKLKDLLVAMDDAPRTRVMDWQAIKVALQIALPANE